MTYAVHSKLVETQDVLDMLELYPTPAQYGDFYLFAQPHHEPIQPVIDMQHIEDMTEFDAAYNQLLTQQHEGRWVYISDSQGAYLLSKYYTETTEEP